MPNPERRFVVGEHGLVLHLLLLNPDSIEANFWFECLVDYLERVIYEEEMFDLVFNSP